MVVFGPLLDMARRVPLVALLIAILSGVGVILQAAADQKAADAYQRYDDPPGDRLIKWHLAGVSEIDDRGSLETIVDSYTQRKCVTVNLQ